MDRKLLDPPNKYQVKLKILGGCGRQLKVLCRLKILCKVLLILPQGAIVS